MTTRHIFFRIILLLFLTANLFALEQTRALWVSRWDYASESDINKIIDNAAQLKFNTILFQVRGAGEALYDSHIEPRSELLANAHWDPLRTAITSAHQADLQLHAWINVYPGWSGDMPPSDSTQLYYRHPDWFMHDVYGRRPALAKGYQWLSPTHPDVNSYLLRVCRELYENYDIDGLHLDYIRFPAASYSYDPASVRVFRQRYGASPEDRPAAWRLWRQNSITAFLDSLYADVKLSKPELVVSAAVVANYELGKKIYFQDSHGWLQRGCVDAVYPMLYTNDTELFKRRLNDFIRNNHNRHVYAGINLEYDDLDGKLDIVNSLGAPGLGIFSYAEIAAENKIKPAIKALLDSVWREKAVPAAMPWKIFIKDNQGPLIAQVQSLPSPLPPNTAFKIAAQINDPSGVFEGKMKSGKRGVRLVIDQETPDIKMQRIKKTRNWFLSEKEIPGRPLGEIFQGKIIAHDNAFESANNPRRNIGMSDTFSMPVVLPDSTFTYVGEIGPILWRPGAIAVDDFGHIWATTEKEGPVVIMDSAGGALNFSPLKKGQNGYFENVWLDGVVGLARGAYNTMLVACNSTPPMIFRFDVETGDALPGIELSFQVGGMATDKEGHLFVLEKNSTRWYVLSQTGVELHGSPYGGGANGGRIAVLGNSAIVCIADWSKNEIQMWHGAVEGAWSQYWRVADLQDGIHGTGGMFVDSEDHIYVCSSRFSAIAVYNRAGRLLRQIIDKKHLTAPIAVTLSGDHNYLYHLEATGNGPAKVRQWRRR